MFWAVPHIVIGACVAALEIVMPWAAGAASAGATSAALRRARESIMMETSAVEGMKVW
jgi:hypothetical protein